MRGVLLVALVSGAAVGILLWLHERIVKPRVPNWLAITLHGLLFGLGLACGGWVGGAMGWRAPDTQLPVILGAALAGAWVGVRRWRQDRAGR